MSSFQKTIVVAAVLLLSITGIAQYKKGAAAVLTGTILSEQTGKPVANAHVYVILGEEEAVTNSRGEYRIESWQKLPVRLTVIQPDYEKIIVPVSSSTQKQVIRLRVKR